MPVSEIDSLPWVRYDQVSARRVVLDGLGRRIKGVLAACEADNGVHVKIVLPTADGSICIDDKTCVVEAYAFIAGGKILIGQKAWDHLSCEVLHP